MALLKEDISGFDEATEKGKHDAPIDNNFSWTP